jgi:transposase-like protein
LIEATAGQLKALRDRNLNAIDLFAIFLDTVHRGDSAFIVALGLDRTGKKYTLGFWEGASENHDIVQALLSDLESRELRLRSKILFITDGAVSSDV